MLTRSSAIFYTSCVHNHQGLADVSLGIYCVRLQLSGVTDQHLNCTRFWIYVGSTFPHVQQKRNLHGARLKITSRRYAKRIALNAFQFAGTKRKQQNHFPLLCQRARTIQRVLKRVYFQQPPCVSPVIWLLRRFRSFFPATVRPPAIRYCATLRGAADKGIPIIIIFTAAKLPVCVQTRGSISLPRIVAARFFAAPWIDIHLISARECVWKSHERLNPFSIKRFPFCMSASD